MPSLADRRRIHPVCLHPARAPQESELGRALKPSIIVEINAVRRGKLSGRHPKTICHLTEFLGSCRKRKPRTGRRDHASAIVQSISLYIDV
jgi:hypothetical protein